jgi:hypothetical protein
MKLTSQQFRRLLAAFRDLLEFAEGVEAAYEADSIESQLATRAANRARRVVRDLNIRLPKHT